jgi:exodeoxyribonuclease V alpha subunit
MTAASPERRPATEEISGAIERVAFHNEDSGFCMLRIKTNGHRETTVGERVCIPKPSDH